MDICKNCQYFCNEEDDNGLEYCHCEFHSYDSRDIGSEFSEESKGCANFKILDYLHPKNMTLDLLNQWLEITKFDPNKTTFNLLNMDDYDIHKTNEFIIKICNEYDQSGFVPLIYVKYFAEKYFKNLKVSVLDILNNHYDDVKALQSFYDELNSDTVKQIEKDFSDKLKMLAASVCSKKYLSDSSDNSFIEGLGFVIDNITKLNVDIFFKGGEIKSFNRISKSVHHFKSLADCLLSIEHAEDGMYLCYISAENSIDGYFGYFIKNNGNVFSVNERLDEKFIGQHGQLRNNRYTEEKLYDLFPYDEVINFSGEDYKGYATNISIDDEMLAFENFKTSTFNCIILTMYLLSKKYVGHTLDGEQVFVNSLLKQNIKSLESSNNDIILYQSNSNIMKYNQSFEFKVDEDKFLNGELCNNYDNIDGNYFQNINQILVDTYGKDFDFQKAYKEILVSDKTKLLTTEQDKDVPKHFNNEFIGNKEKFETQAFYELREKLAKHIETKMLEDFKSFGGKKGLAEWWENLLLSNIDKLKSLCKDVHLDESKGLFDLNCSGIGRVKYNYKIAIIKEYTEDQIKEKGVLLACSYSNHNFWKDKLNPIKDRFTSKYKYIDLDDGHTCKYFFCFKPYNWEWIENTFEVQVPKFLKGWYNSHYFETPYTGNPMLDIVDPVDMIDNIINCRNSNYRFELNFFIGFSTNNFKRILNHN